MYKCLKNVLEGQDEPEGGLGGLEGPPWGTQQFLGDQKKSDLPHELEGLVGVEGFEGLQHWLPLFHASFFPQVGVGGEECLGTQQPFCECQYQA